MDRYICLLKAYIYISFQGTTSSMENFLHVWAHTTPITSQITFPPYLVSPSFSCLQFSDYLLQKTQAPWGKLSPQCHTFRFPPPSLSLSLSPPLTPHPLTHTITANISIRIYQRTRWLSDHEPLLVVPISPSAPNSWWVTCSFIDKMFTVPPSLFSQPP